VGLRLQLLLLSAAALLCAAVLLLLLRLWLLLVQLLTLQRAQSDAPATGQTWPLTSVRALLLRALLLCQQLWMRGAMVMAVESAAVVQLASTQAITA
jgi:hypothetical protein